MSERSVGDIVASLQQKRELIEKEQEGEVEGLTTTDYKEQGLRNRLASDRQKKATSKSIEVRREARLGKQEVQEQYYGTLKQQQQLGGNAETKREPDEDVREPERPATLPLRSPDPTVKLLELGGAFWSEAATDGAASGGEESGVTKQKRKRSI